MVGYAMEDAKKDLVRGKKAMLKKAKALAKKKNQHEEEWTGCGSGVDLMDPSGTR